MRIRGGASGDQPRSVETSPSGCRPGPRESCPGGRAGAAPLRLLPMSSRPTPFPMLRWTYREQPLSVRGLCSGRRCRSRRFRFPSSANNVAGIICGAFRTARHGPAPAAARTGARARTRLPRLDLDRALLPLVGCPGGSPRRTYTSGEEDRALGAQARSGVRRWRSSRHTRWPRLARPRPGRSDRRAAPLTQAAGPHRATRPGRPDLVLNAIVGFAGLPATLWALERGVDLRLRTRRASSPRGSSTCAQRRGGGRLIPVDSEHSGAFQCLETRSVDQVHSLVLTASVDLSRARTRRTGDVKPEAALPIRPGHGLKITVDSATSQTKLELIEPLPLRPSYEQSRSSSIDLGRACPVRFRDGATLAHLGYPDMRVPSPCTHISRTEATPIRPSIRRRPDARVRAARPRTFPLLAHARLPRRAADTVCLQCGGRVAVAASSRDGCVPRIADVVADALAVADGSTARDVDDSSRADAEARRQRMTNLKVA